MHIGESSVEVLPWKVDVMFAVRILLSVIRVERIAKELVPIELGNTGGTSEGPKVELTSDDGVDDTVRVEVEMEDRGASNLPFVDGVAVVSSESSTASEMDTVGIEPAGSDSVETDVRDSKEDVVKFTMPVSCLGQSFCYPKAYSL